MTLPEFSVNRKITVLMLILIISLFGVLSFFRLGLDMMPDLEYPVVSVVTTYEGVSSEDIENLITEPVEEVVSAVKNVKKVTSISQEGISAVIVEFEWGTKLDFAAQDVREKLSWLTDYLPEDADSPLVVKFNTADYPILYYGVTGMEDTRTLRKYLDDNVRPRLERLEGVASVYIMGGLEREINVFIDRDKLDAFNISIDQVVGKLAMENVNVSGGHVTKGYIEYLVRTMGEYKDVDAIRNTIVAMHGTTPVYIKDIAAVQDTYKEIRNYARTNGRPSVIFMIMKQSGVNTVSVIKRVKKTLTDIKKYVPPDILFYPVMDQGRVINKVTHRTGQNAILGGIFAILMIFAFLLDWRPTLTVALAIPLSVVTTFIGIHIFDYTLNIMTLGGMALGVGMLVDNAVVVIENTFRHLEEGKDRNAAAKLGAEEVGMAITASTLTTIAVFLPMTLSSGIAGRLSRPLAVTVTLALLASLFVALTIVPMISSVLFKKERNKKRSNEKTISLFFMNVRGRYTSMLRWSLGHRKTVIIIAALSFLVSIAAVPILGTEFMPKQDIPLLMMKINLPVGTSLNETNRAVKKIENIILKQPETRFVASFIGLSRETKMDVAWGFGAADVNEAEVFVRLVDREERVRSAETIMEYIRSRIEKVKGAQFEFLDMGQMLMGATGGETPVAVKVFGKDLDKLRIMADKIAEGCKNVKGLKDIDTTLKMGKPELQIMVDREKASQMGLTVGRIAQTVKAAMLGVVPTKYRIGGDEYDIRVRFRDFDRQSIADVGNIKIATPAGNLVPLYHVADFVKKMGPVKITREDQERNVTVTANTFERDIGGIVEDIKSIESGMDVPEGYFIEYGGTYEDMREAFVSLAQALAIAIILIYMIMAAQFESLLHPFVIMFTVPLSFIGAVFGLIVFHKTHSVPAFMGMIILSGVVVNNGIVMIDYINHLRRKGVKPLEAIVEGATIRLRPVLITTFTTVAGMLPMALSQTQGSELRSPMAVAVASGLLFSTFLTLFVIPVVYSIAGRVKMKGI